MIEASARYEILTIEPGGAHEAADAMIEAGRPWAD